MEYRTLGSSGLRISRLSLGAMTFGAGTGIWGEIAGLDRAQATRLVAMAVEHGINLIDTADAYSQGQSEAVVGQVLADLGLDESRMLVATKVRLRTGAGHNDVGLGRSHIMRSVETSLRRIGRDHIDLFQLHDRDALVPLEETLRALDDLVTQGKVRHIGVCNFSAGDLERAQGITTRTHWARVVSNQVHYALTSRDIEHEIAPVGKANNVALLVWSPLAGGYLSGKYTAGSASGEMGRRATLNFPPIDPMKADPIVFELREIATELDSTPAQVALAWVLGRSETTSVIIGARTEAHLEDNLNAQRVVLSDTQRDRLDRVSQPAVTYPHWMQQFHDKDRILT
ncbi:1-deoxyxylulose-5-phosphate synthase YajO [Paraburkholderia hiiakae]|uniref:1-deoxyxylulose-5-phosphate synthase YajO n=1 Tax=Paraburkholderia hiiakae TaxID=1081782 RepID=A0ABM8P8M8_9BURK|nr:aldo/keto reductase [Paraburkholderia hiiakae]CAD6559219.1 1-deoxyxylulose-5-phosphate synthase YajO [Paraburkholderia hiiakae]